MSVGSVTTLARSKASNKRSILTSTGALSLEKLERVIVDGSHIDQKKRGIFDMRETQQPLMQLLNRPVLKNRYAIGTNEGDVQLIIY